MTATPRPYHVIDLDDTLLIRSGEGDTLTYVAEIRLTGVPHGEGRANARYILRAVNSYDAMKEALDTLLQYAIYGLDGLPGPDHSLTRAVEKAQAALALAKGEQ